MENLDLKQRFMEQPTAEWLSETQIMDSFVDVAGIEQFWHQWYLNGFVDTGVGKVKFLRGRSGSGKTHLLRRLGLTAKQSGYVVAHVDAKRTRIMAIDELYKAITVHIPWDEIIDRAAMTVIRESLGYQDFDLQPSEFYHWASETHGRSSSILATDVRDETDKWIQGQDIHSAWVLPVRSLILRRINGEVVEEEPTFRWLRGEKLKAAERRGIGVSTNVDRRNARAMLLSMAVLVHAVSYRGLVVLVDNADVMARVVREEGIPYYTRGNRDQAYEMLRQLIDESHLSAYLFLVVAGNTDLYDNQKTGFPSYPALIARIQSEITAVQLNRFADLVDLDALLSHHREDQARLLNVWTTIGGEVELDAAVQVSDAEETNRREPESVRRTVVRALAKSLEGMNHEL
jgi:hypothetical protein